VQYATDIARKFSRFFAGLDKNLYIFFGNRIQSLTLVPFFGRFGLNHFIHFFGNWIIHELLSLYCIFWLKFLYAYLLLSFFGNDGVAFSN